MIKVLLADDQPLIRSAVRALVDREEDMTVVGEAATGTEAVQLTRQLTPDLVLMDIRMPEGDGIWATGQIADDETLTNVHVLVLTTFEEDAYIFEALQAGASGFLGKGTDGPNLTNAIRSVARGDSLLSPIATRKLIETYLSKQVVTNRNPDHAARLTSLTERESEVLQRIGLGLSNAEIAEELFISPLTVKTHVHRLMTKFQVHDRSQLVIEAYESGLVKPGDARFYR